MWKSLDCLCVGRGGSPLGLSAALTQGQGAMEPWLCLPHPAAHPPPLTEPGLSGSPVCFPQRKFYLHLPVSGLARASQGVSAYCLVTGTSFFLGARLILPPPE